jgi:hypothetical protein
VPFHGAPGWHGLHQRAQHHARFSPITSSIGLTSAPTDRARRSQRGRAVGQGSTTCTGCHHVCKHVSERDLNPMTATCGFTRARCVAGRITAGQRRAYVSEDRGLPIAHPSDIALTARLSSAVPDDHGRSGHQVDHCWSRGRCRSGRRDRVLRARLRSGEARGEAGWIAHLVPLTVDGLMYASSMVLLDSARRMVPVPGLAWWLLDPGIPGAPSDA